ncbi:MAG: ATP-binding protein, partial [Treponema sp.]|nr:ATP-binding protein [Treponema sp.]
MRFNIDLKELSVRESEKIEWKETGDDPKIIQSIVKTISALANDLSNFGGGYVVCGAKESKDQYGFQKVLYTGLTSSKIREIEGKVLQHCRDHVHPSIAPIIEEVDNPEEKSKRILVFIVMASPHAHTYRDGEKTAYYVRTGRETREARNGILTQLLTAKQRIEPFDRRPNPNTAETDMDLLFLRDCVLEMKLRDDSRPLDVYLSDREQIAEFVPPLLAKKKLDDSLCLRNFTLFLFGKKE